MNSPPQVSSVEDIRNMSVGIPGENKPGLGSVSLNGIRPGSGYARKTVRFCSCGNGDKLTL
jgi:hypothetical protein